MAVSVKGHAKRDRRMGQFVYAFDPDHPIRGIYVSYFSGKNRRTHSTLKEVIQVGMQFAKQENYASQEMENKV